MNIFIIYKQINDSSGNPIKVELIECDQDDKGVQSYTKLYNLQVPNDLKNRISYHFIQTRVI